MCRYITCSFPINGVILFFLIRYQYRWRSFVNLQKKREEEVMKHMVVAAEDS